METERQLETGAIPLTDKKALKREVECCIKFQRTRVSDCTRLMFKEGDINGWMDIDSDDIVSPIYPLPELSRTRYHLHIGYPFDRVIVHDIFTEEGRTINDVVRQICRIMNEIWNMPFIKNKQVDSLEDVYLWGLYLKKDGTAWIEMETLN